MENYRINNTIILFKLIWCLKPEKKVVNFIKKQRFVELRNQIWFFVYIDVYNINFVAMNSDYSSN
jgi:hypothetical protein